MNGSNVDEIKIFPEEMLNLGKRAIGEEWEKGSTADELKEEETRTVWCLLATMAVNRGVDF